MFPITREETTSMEVISELPILHDHAVANINEPVLHLVKNEDLINVFQRKELILVKKKRSSWKPNKRIDPVYLFILHLFYFKLFKTDKNLTISIWMNKNIKKLNNNYL